jgi:DNA-binding transcriptional ArsR family regulator
MPPKTIEGNVVDHRLIRALGHPIRVRALTILNERVASPNELARQLGAHLGSVSYHVRILLELGAIELVKTEPRRGAVEHFYRATMRPFFNDADWAAVPESLRQSISAAMLELVWNDVQEACQSGAFDARDDVHLSRTPLVVDEQGWRDVGDLLAEALDRVLDIQAESAARLAESGEEGLATKLELIYFPSASTKANDGTSSERKAAAKGGRA